MQPVVAIPSDRRALLGVPAPIVSLRNVSVRLGDACSRCADARSARCGACGAARALHDVSLDVNPGEVVGVAGGPGAGKTTLLRVLAGRLAPDTGEVLFSHAGDLADPPLIVPGEALAEGIRHAHGHAPVWPRVTAAGPADDPCALLFDDPFSGHDPSLQAMLIDLVDRLAAERAWGAVVVGGTDVLRVLADRVVVLHRGAVAETGVADSLLDDPATVT